MTIKFERPLSLLEQTTIAISVKKIIGLLPAVVCHRPVSDVKLKYLTKCLDRPTNTEGENNQTNHE